MSETRSIRREVSLPCTVERGFDLLLRPGAIRAWWQAARAIVLPGADGLWCAAWGDDEDEPDYTTAARMRVFEPPTRLVLDRYSYRSRFGPLPFEAEFEVEFTLRPDGAGCVLAVEQRGFPADAAADAYYAGCVQGWRETLAGLVRYVGAPRLETERLRLRPLSVDDAAFVLELVNEPAFLEHIGDKRVRDLAAARRFLRESSWVRQELAGHGMLAVEPLAGGAPLGVCGLLHRPALGLSDVGFAFLAAHCGRGFATEAARAVVRHGRDALGLERVHGIVAPANAASIRVLEKLGLRPLRSVRLADDEPDVLLYA
ncbi:MAG TPA: GNAT family N-acetyltransferase [Planctomycetota bacterium]|nr:GNAT family N-acetyltransferase [Planctomycetota bacterium]